jgi:SM-20-related protein
VQSVAENPSCTIDAIVSGIANRGFAVAPDFLDQAGVVILCDRACALDARGQMKSAGVGRGVARRERGEFRGDRICWIEDDSNDPAEAQLRAHLEVLRLALNRATALGLFDFEGHYALYPPGAGYTRHRDRFVDDDARVVSCVLYLNPEWRMEDGGALRLYLDAGRTLDVLPQSGTLVVFLADAFDHEVLPATRERRSVAGWFRRRT